MEIAKALSVDARVLILDEPTAALSGKEVSQLFNVMNQLRRRGVGMIFISHHLDEIARIADSVSVLRDGQCVAEGDSLIDAAHFAARVGATAVLQPGAQTSYPRLKEVIQP